MQDFENNKTFPCASVYKKHFGSWNNGLKAIGLNINKIGKLDGNEKCEICHTHNTSSWYYQNDMEFVINVM